MCYQNPTVWYEVTVRGIATSLTNAVWSITITQLLRFKFQFRLQLHRQTFIRSFKRPCFKLIAQVSIFFHLGWQDSIRISFNVALRLQSFGDVSWYHCQVIMGEPPAEHKAAVHQVLLRGASRTFKNREVRGVFPVQCSWRVQKITRPLDSI